MSPKRVAAGMLNYIQNRAIGRDNAQSKIQIEQAKQKRAYDLKVEPKRLLIYVLEFS